MYKKKLKINKTAKPPEIITAKLLGDCFFKDKALIVGDDFNLKTPDIFTEDLSVGIEVVQLDRGADLDTKYIWEEMKKKIEDYNDIKKFCDDKHSGKYNLVEKEGKIFGFYSNKLTHSKTWMKDSYSGNIKKKLKKLNNGNYSGIEKEINLCIIIVYKIIRKFDAELIAYCYKQIEESHEKSFNKIYIIESNKTFVIYPSRIKEIEPVYDDRSIIGFNVIGENYIEEMNVRYSAYFDN